MSGGTEYDDQLDCHEEGTPAQLAARRTRRRRRHGKKQADTGFRDTGFRDTGGRDAPFEDARGRWLPPPSATTLTLAQLGIHVPSKREGQDATLTLAQLGLHVAPPTLPPHAAPEVSSRNVVTCSDLDLFGFVAKTSPSPGATDFRNTLPPPPRPQPCMPLAAPTWQQDFRAHRVEERPWERILSVPSPQVAVSLPESLAMPHHWVPPRPQNQPPHIAPTPHHVPSWNAEPDPALRHWLCSGQYGAQPIFHDPRCDSGLLLAAAPPVHAAPACSENFGMPPPPPPPVAPAPGCTRVAVDMEPPPEEASHSTQLETLLETLAAEAYQD